LHNPKQIPHLIKLLDDESSDIRNNIIRELASFGPNLKEELDNIPFLLNPTQKEHVKKILRGHRRLMLKKAWSSWYQLPSEIQKLECAVTILSEYLQDPTLQDSVTDVTAPKVKSLLDDLVGAYQEKYRVKNAKLLAQFLFKELGLKGNEKDYYNPQNSNLIYVINNKKGIPISLATIYILVGSRLGLKIEGCNFPGHFLAKIQSNGKDLYVDCFSSGQLIEEEDIIHLQGDTFEGIEGILKEKVTPEMMIRRYLANFIRIYQMQQDEENSRIMIDLFKDLDTQMYEKKIEQITPEDIINSLDPHMGPGVIVRHLRYGYRGIIVDVDHQCQATDGWYYGNQTQPNRHQPWYHVLVDGSDQVTYVAESNLVIDGSYKKIEHPLLTYFFTKLEGGDYIRNDHPWPETEY